MQLIAIFFMRPPDWCSNTGISKNIGSGSILSTIRGYLNGMGEKYLFENG